MDRVAAWVLAVLLLFAAIPSHAQKRWGPPKVYGVVPLPGMPIYAPGVVSMEFREVFSTLKANGYTIKIVQQAPQILAFDFEKSAWSEGKGLLGIKWAQKIEGTAQYYNANGKWVYVGGDIRAWEKPPIIGGWKAGVVDSATVAQVNRLFADYSELPKKTVDIVK